MKIQPKKLTPRQDDFISMIEQLRHELTAKFSIISSQQEMNVETAKLLKEIATIIKELDRLIKDDRELSQSDKDQNSNTFFNQIKQDSLLETF